MPGQELVLGRRGNRSQGRRLSANALLAVIPWLLPSAVAVVAIPITVRGLGADAYGVVALVGSVTGYLAVMELGVGAGVTRYIAMFVSLGHGRSIRECLRIVLVWSLGVGVVGGVTVWMLAPRLATDLLRVPTHLTSSAITAFRIGGAAFLIGMLVSVLSVVPQAFLRYDTIALVQSALAAASFAGPAIIVTLGYDLVPVMWFGLALNAVACLTWAVVGGRLVASVPHEGPPFGDYRRPFLSFALTETINRIWNIIPEQTPRIIIGMVGGTTPVAYYQVSSTVAVKVNELVTRMATVLFPTVAQMAATNEHDRIADVYMRSSRLLFLLNGSITAAVVVFSGPLLRYWIGPRYATQGAVVLALMALGQLVAASSQPAGNVNRALGRPRINLAFTIMSSAVLLSTVYTLTVSYGIAGTALAWSLSCLVWLGLVHYANRRVLSIGSWAMFRDCLVRPAAINAVLALIARLALMSLARSFLATLALMALTAGAGIVVGAAAGVITPADRAAIRAALHLGSRSPSAGDGSVGGDCAAE